MRVETIPLIVGGVVGLIGVAILADAWLPEDLNYFRERRRQQRVERSVFGEACVGLAVLCMAAVLAGRDSWPYVNVAMIAAAIFFLIGLVKSWNYLRERITNRGSLRRGQPVPPKPARGPQAGGSDVQK